jgi:hypothetical protein
VAPSSENMPEDGAPLVKMALVTCDAAPPISALLRADVNSSAAVG